MVLLIALAGVACHTEGVEEVRNSTQEAAIVLNIEGGTLGIATRAESIADSGAESHVNHLDIMIFEDAADVSISVSLSERAANGSSIPYFTSTKVVAAAATGGNIRLRNVIPKHVESITAKLCEMEDYRALKKFRW